MKSHFSIFVGGLKKFFGWEVKTEFTTEVQRKEENFSRSYRILR